MAQALGFILSTDGAILVLFAGALMMILLPRSSLVRRIAFALALAYVVASIYPIPAAASRWWSRGYEPFATRGWESSGTAIVLLGGGEDQVRGWSKRWFVMSLAEAERVLEAARVFKLIAPDWIISSGGGPSSDDTARPSSEVMRDGLVQLGVPASRILLESSSRDTHDEAMAIAPMLIAHRITRVVLVTSAVHMRRALGVFRAAGIDATPAIALPSGPDRRWSKWWLPSKEGLEASAQLAHEVIGTPYYWMRGWYR